MRAIYIYAPCPQTTALLSPKFKVIFLNKSQFREAINQSGNYKLFKLERAQGNLIHPLQPKLNSEKVYVAFGAFTGKQEDWVNELTLIQDPP